MVVNKGNQAKQRFSSFPKTWAYHMQLSYASQKDVKHPCFIQTFLSASFLRAQPSRDQHPPTRKWLISDSTSHNWYTSQKAKNKLLWTEPRGGCSKQLSQKKTERGGGDDSILSNSIHRILQSIRISARQKIKGFLGMRKAKGRLPSSRVRDT